MVFLDATTNIPFSSAPLQLIGLGLLVPVGGYLINWAIAREKLDNETVKTGVQIILVAVASAGYDFYRGGTHHFARDFVSVLLANMYSHNWLWKPSDINVYAGAAPTGDQTTKGLSAQKYGRNMTAEQVRRLRLQPAAERRHADQDVPAGVHPSSV